MTDELSNRVPASDIVGSGFQKPISLGVGLVAVGVLLGLATPLSDFERQRLKRLGEDIARRAVEARDEIVDQSKMVVHETVTAAQESVQKHGHEIAATLHLGGLQDSSGFTSAPTQSEPGSAATSPPSVPPIVG